MEGYLKEIASYLIERKLSYRFEPDYDPVEGGGIFEILDHGMFLLVDEHLASAFYNGAYVAQYYSPFRAKKQTQINQIVSFLEDFFAMRDAASNALYDI